MALPPASTQKSPVKLPHLSIPHAHVSLWSLSSLNILYLCLLLLKGKFQKGGDFSFWFTCYRLCQEACLAETKHSEILLGENDVKQAGQHREQSRNMGLYLVWDMYLHLLIMQLASQLCYLHVLCTPPSFNNVDSILRPPLALDGIGFSSPNNN